MCTQVVHKSAVLGSAIVAKTEFVKIRLSEREKDGFEQAANLAGISLSAWMRERLRRAAIRELEEASKPIPFIGGERQ
jgi:predicted HTH domain antitoxin